MEQYICELDVVPVLLSSDPWPGVRFLNFEAASITHRDFFLSVDLQYLGKVSFGFAQPCAPFSRRNILSTEVPALGNFPCQITYSLLTSLLLEIGS